MKFSWKIEHKMIFKNITFEVQYDPRESNKYISLKGTLEVHIEVECDNSIR